MATAAAADDVATIIAEALPSLEDEQYMRVQIDSRKIFKNRLDQSINQNTD
jgi:hypothetical protein